MAQFPPSAGGDGATRVQLLGRGSETPIFGAGRNERIFAIAAAQRGLAARWQLRAIGIGSNTIDRLADSGLLRRVHRGVYAVGPAAPIPLAGETAALLAVRRGAALSHHTGAILQALERPECSDGLIHVTVPGASLQDPDGVRVHRSVILAPRDIRLCQGLPVTSPPRVLLDLAPIVPERELERALEQMLIQRLAGLGHVRELLSRAGRHAGRPILRALVDDYTTSTFTRSEAEERFLALIRRGGLPQPLANSRYLGCEIDYFWPDHKVAVEIDGFVYHSTRARFERDRRRDAKLRQAGITVIRITVRQLEREPEAVLVDVAQALARSAR